MSALRKSVKPWAGNGTPVYENGVIIGELVLYAEWSHHSKAVYDDVVTCWKEVKMADIPNLILNSDEIEV